MQAWKPLLIVLPTGLMLGAIGGQYARPVMTDQADESSLQSAFKSRAEHNRTSGNQAQPEDAEYYAGGYSYPPYLDDRMLGGDREITGWQGPSFADWPEYRPSSPSAAQLEAQLAARDAALGRRAWDSFGTGDEQTAAEAAADAAADAAANASATYRSGPFGGDGGVSGSKVAALPPSSGSTTSREPHTPDSNLPAIW